MQNVSVENKLTPEESVDIRVIRPTGISSVWHWLTNRNKEENVQRFMYDKKFKLKLNEEELAALKRNGIDFQKLQALAGDRKVRKNILILSKDQCQLNKNISLNSDLMGKKNLSIKQRKCKKSQLSLGNLVVESNDNVLNSKITYVHRIRSKKSVNSVNSKASLKVGLKCKMSDISVSKQKNILMNEIPEGLLTGNKQKRVFIPIYIGKKRSNKSTKIYRSKHEKLKIIGNESNVIPLLLTKLNKMEGKISDIEKATKIKIKETVSKKMIEENSDTKTTKGSPTTSHKGFTTHKLHGKKSLKTLKHNRSGSKIKLITSTVNKITNSSNITKNRATSVENTSNKDRMYNIRNMLDSPKSFIKHHSFVIPNELSEKTLFKANPDAGCDMILKLFESMADSSSNGQTNNLLSSVQVIMGQQQTEGKTKSELGSCENPKVSSSISESHLSLYKNEEKNKHKIYPKQKKNIACPSSSTLMNYEDKSYEESHTSKNPTSVDNTDSYSSETLNHQNNLRSNKTELENLYESNNTEVIPLGQKPWIFFNNDNSGCQKAEDDSSTLNESGGVKESDNSKDKVSPNKQNPSYVEEPRENEDHIMKTVHENIKFESITNNYDNLSQKSDENNLQGLQLQVSEGKIGRQIIKLPLGTDSANICSICIEPAVDINTVKVSEVDVKGPNIYPDTKTEPKFSITILVKNILSDDKLVNQTTSTKSNPWIENPSSKIGDLKECLGAEKSFSPLGQGDGPSRIQKSLEEEVKESPRMFLPPLRYDIPHVFPTNITVSTTVFNCSVEKGLNKLDSDKKTQYEFGIQGGSYLNQEQRKKIEAQMSNSVSCRKSEELTCTVPRLGVKSSMSLKNNGHLNTDNRCFSVSCTLPTSETSLKSCRKSSHDLLESFNQRKDIGVAKGAQRKNSNQKLKSGQAFECLDTGKALVRTGDDFYSFSTSINSTGYSDVFCKIPSPIPDTARCKQDFVILCKENPNTSLRNVEEPSAKKRLHRCNMTLKEPILLDLTSDIPTINRIIGKPDRLTRNINIVSDNLMAEDSFEKNSHGLKPEYHEKRNIRNDSYKRTNLPEVSNLEDITPYKNRHEIFCLQSDSATSKQIDWLTNKDITYSCDEKNNYFDESKLIPPNKTGSPGSSCGGVNLKSKSSNCSCILSMLDEPHKRVNCRLVTLPSTGNDLPKLCPCTVEQVNSDTGNIIKIGNRLLLQKSGQEPCEIWKMGVLCRQCLKKCKNKDAVFGCSSKCSNHEMYTKQKHLDVNNPEKYVNDDVMNGKCQQFNIRNEIPDEISVYKPIGLNSRLINEDNTSLITDKTVDSLIDAKIQNEIESIDTQNICCHSCLAICSDDSMCSDNNKPENSFCLDMPDSEFSKELELGSGICRYYSTKNESYEVENVANSTTIFHFKVKEDIGGYIFLPEKCCECQAAKDTKAIKNLSPEALTDSIRNEKHRENNEFAEITDPKEDLYKSIQVCHNMTAQSKDQNKRLKCSPITGDKWFGNASPILSTNVIHTQKKQNQCVEQSSNTALPGNKTFTSYKTSRLKTATENDHSFKSTGNEDYVQHSKPQNIGCFTNYFVNCVRSIEFDIRGNNRNNALTCSLNSFSSKDQKL